MTEGIVTVGSVPPIPGGGVPAALFTTMTATAPASWAFLTFTLNEQVPLSTTAILPFTAAAFAADSAVQARPRLGAVSTTGITSAVTPGLLSGGPKLARPTK